MSDAEELITVYFDLRYRIPFGVDLNKALEPGFYFAPAFRSMFLRGASKISKSVIWNAERIWIEDSNEIWWFKNKSIHGRIDGRKTPADLAEFAWVKLKAKSIT